VILTFDSPDEAQLRMQSEAICRVIGEVLVKHYPNRQWHVDASAENGVAKIQCPSISMRHGFVVKIHGKTVDDIQKATVIAGGQILEMFRLSREKGARGGEEFILRDARGEAIHAATGL
jgi:hypothetical protein